LSVTVVVELLFAVFGSFVVELTLAVFATDFGLPLMATSSVIVAVLPEDNVPIEQDAVFVPLS
jgi:hypothetical protein